MTRLLTGGLLSLVGLEGRDGLPTVLELDATIEMQSTHGRLLEKQMHDGEKTQDGGGHDYDGAVVRVVVVECGLELATRIPLKSIGMTAILLMVKGLLLQRIKLADGGGYRLALSATTTNLHTPNHPDFTPPASHHIVMDAFQWMTWPKTTRQMVVTMCGLRPDATFDEVQAASMKWPSFRSDMRRHESEAVSQTMFFETDQDTDALWTRRWQDGHDPDECKTSSPFEMQKLTFAALQLLFICDPQRALYLAKATDRDDEATLELSDSSRVLQTWNGRTEQPQPEHEAWKVVFSGSRFCGEFGVLFNRLDSTSIMVPSEAGQKPWIAVTDGPVDNWLESLRAACGPQKFDYQGLTSSLQPCVKEAPPPYLALRIQHGISDECNRIPRGDFEVAMRGFDGIPRLMRLRWVGGLYGQMEEDGIRTVIIFDWGDSRRGIGMSMTGDWETEPPARYKRVSVEQQMGAAGIQPKMMLFRRI
ncbi:hypothetical protein HDK64DRAFT_320604 [Phyllosticta capitalensis]